MKKLFFSLLATVFMSITSNAQAFKNTISIDLGLGKVSSYAGNCLPAAGFCVTKSDTPPTIDVAYAGLSVTPEGKVSIQMNDKYYKKIASGIVNGHIVVGTTFSLPKELLDAIGIKTEYPIYPGKYSPVVSNNVYSFTF